MASVKIPESQQYYYVRKGKSGNNINDISNSPTGGDQFWTKVTNPNYVAPDTRTTTQKLSDEYTSAYNEAKISNESRYNELLSNIDAQKAEATSLLEGYGTAQKANIADQYKQSLSNSIQNLAGTGLYNTTAYGNTQTSNATAQTNAENALNESINTQKLNAYGTINAAKNSVIENRTDEYPDLSTYLNLMAQSGEYGTNGSSSSSTSSGSSSSGTGNKVSVTFTDAAGKKHTNYGNAFSSATPIKVGGGTTKKTSFKNNYGSTIAGTKSTKLSTPNSYTTNHNSLLTIPSSSGKSNYVSTPYGIVKSDKGTGNADNQITNYLKGYKKSSVKQKYYGTSSSY
jgi:hypothetical protein